MDLIEYQIATKRTVSDRFYASYVDGREFAYYLEDAIEAGNALDEIKKALFYGKSDRPFSSSPIWDVGCFKDAATTEGILHGILGVISEASELAEALLVAVDEENEIDRINLKEEIGDILWYLSLLLNEIDSDFEEVAEMNIRKLQSRYPKKFSEDKALNRNLEIERRVLEE